MLLRTTGSVTRSFHGFGPHWKLGTFKREEPRWSGVCVCVCVIILSVITVVASVQNNILDWITSFRKLEQLQ